MPKHRIHVESTIELPPERVFGVFADHRKFGKLLGAPIKQVDPSPVPGDPNGLGSVRHVGIGPITFQEKITSFKPAELIEYEVIQGGPIKNHHGRIEFSPSETDGCHVSYVIEFDPKIPMTGGAIEAALRQALQKGMGKVAQLA